MAVKKILGPIGCKQHGRSRVWIADQRFWVIYVEFQPSGFSKGSYLNVGASWLWHRMKYLSFDHGSRVGGFTPFIDEDQFAAEAQKLATRAAEEVGALRGKFPSISSIAQQMVLSDDAQGWPAYHAAVATGLAGDIVASKRLFERVGAELTSSDFDRHRQVDVVELVGKLGDNDEFRAAVLAIIELRRVNFRLPPDPTCLDAA